MNNNLLSYIDNSFLAPLLMDSGVTDISYNGVSLFYQHNVFGRKKARLFVTSDEINDFIRQIANMSEKQFSFTSPFLDISIDRYRINAVHSSITRVNNDKALSFSMRIASKELRINNDKEFMDDKAKTILETALKENKSIVIAGPTGSGKTELQKYLLSSLKENTRIIIIDNIQELEFVRVNKELDITSWQVNTNNSIGTFEELIRNALRSNPDWLVIAESRGKEMNDVLNSVMSGHPIISTLHAQNVMMMPHRMARMVEMSDSTQKYDDIMSDILEHIPYYIYLNKYFDENNKVHRYIETIAKTDLTHKKLEIIYRKETRNEKR